MVNFGIVYGLTGFGLADRLNIPRKEGEEFVARYLERFPAVRAFREEVVERAQEEGYVTTLMGRRRAIPELRSGNPNTRRLGERLAVNTVIQGTAADIIKVAMVRCQRRAARGRGGDPPGPADPRRAALRGPAGGDGRRDRAGAARDVRRLPARPAARGRRRRRPGLARRQVARASAGQLDLVEGGVAVLELQLGLLDRPRRRSGRRWCSWRRCRCRRGRSAATGAVPDPVSSPELVALAAVVVAGLFAVAAVVVAGLVAVTAVSSPGSSSPCASACVTSGECSSSHLIRVPVGDQAADRVAVEAGRSSVCRLLGVEGGIVPAFSLPSMIPSSSLSRSAQVGHGEERDSAGRASSAVRAGLGCRVESFMALPPWFGVR